MRLFVSMAVSALAVAVLTSCANWTIAPVGQVECTTRTADGDLREESVVGLLALPTPSHRTVIAIPLFMSSRLPDARTNQLPPAVQAWVNQQAETLPPVTP